jgi:sugar lactone lactonase YvrE
MIDAERFIYRVEENWGQLPHTWQWGVITAVACDSEDRVFVYSRSANPLMIFDKRGNYIASWGEGILSPETAHGIYIDGDDNVYCTALNHCVRKFSSTGKLVLTLGTPDKPGAKDGVPFNKPTDLGMASTGELFVADGYENHNIHKFSPEGRLLLSWGEAGLNPGQFATPHCVRIDKQDRVWVCDRENLRIQIFDLEGNYSTEIGGLLRPEMIHIDHSENVVYIAEVGWQVSIYSLDGKLITKWGGNRQSKKPGEFFGAPHGICADSEGNLYVTEVLVDGRIQKFVRC